MNKKNLLKFYGFGISSLNTLYKENGLNFFKLKSKIDLSINKEEKLEQLFNDMEKVVVLNIPKKEVFLKEKKMVLEKKKKNGSYKGYKYSLGLPIFNQRTKTNSRTSRKRIL